jgi:APA family basic amino acid/polyamine antiporter
LLKLLPLILIGTVGLWFVDADTLPPLNPGSGSAVYLFASSFALTFWNYVGIESATVPAEDVVQPEKTVPRALILGTLTVMVVYLLVAFVVMGVIPAAELAQAEAPLAEAGTRIAGYWGSFFITAGAVVSIGGCLNVSVLCAGQSAMAAARDRVFPAVFGRLGSRGTPAASYVIVGLLVSGMVLVNYTRGMVAAYTFIVMVSALTIVVPYAFSAMAALLLDVQDHEADRGRRLREAFVAGVAFLVSLWVMATAGQEPVYWVFLLIIGGIPVYVVATRGSRRD